MSNPSRLIRIAGLIWILCCTAASGAAAQPGGVDSLEYGRLVTALRSGERDIDFTRLRMAYVASPGYAPYGDSRLFLAMMGAVEAEDFERALVFADSVLAQNHLEATAHLVAWMSARLSGQESRAPYHAWVARGLVQSIGGRGGRTPETAMVVIDLAEEYAYLRYHGLELLRRVLGTCGENDCDILQVRDPRSGEEYALHFDVSIPRRWFLQQGNPGARRGGTES